MINDSPPSAVNFGDTSLGKLAKFAGIELEYVNAAGESVAIAPEVVRAVLAAMNLDVRSDTNALAELEVFEQKEQERRLPPVMVIREDEQPATVQLRFDAAETGLAWRVVLENGITIDGHAEQ